MNREEMVEAAADAIRWASEHGGWAKMAAAALAVFEEAQKPSNVRNGEHSEGDYEAGYEEGFHHGRSTPEMQREPTDAQVLAASREYHERGNGAGSFDRMADHVRESLIFRMRAALRAAGVTAEEPGPVTDAQRRNVFGDFLSYRLLPAAVREYLEGYLEAMDDE